MRINYKKENKGFTIIEVLIVLAIAGLIMLIVLLAIPALQRNARNTAIRNDASKAASLLQEAVNNNNGTIPAAATEATSTTTSCPTTAPVVPTVMCVANAKYSRATTVKYAASGSFIALPTALAEDTLYVRDSSACGTLAGNVGSQAVSNTSARSATVTFLVESPGTSAGTGATGQNLAGTTVQCVDAN